MLDDDVLFKNFSSVCPKWLTGKVIAVKGPVSYEVQLTDGMVVHSHLDHIRSGISFQSSSEVSTSHMDNLDIVPSVELPTDDTTGSVEDLPQP